MNKLFEEAVATVRELPDSEQEIAARFLLGYSNPDAPRYRLSDEQVAEVELAKQDVRQGRIATDAEMDEVWRRFDQ